MSFARRLKKWFPGLAAGTNGGPSHGAILEESSRQGSLNLAAQILESDGFARRLDPKPRQVDGITPILVLAPHQDDEAIGAGGLLLLAKRAGCEVCISFVTDGGPKPDAPGVDLYGSAADYIKLRDTEAARVCRELGAEMHRLGISNARPAPTVGDLDRLTQLIERISPKALLVPWLLDGAPKHRMVSHLLWLANTRKALPECEVWSYQVNNTLLPNSYVDVTDVIQAKRELIEVYASQNDYLRRYDHQTIGLNAWNSRYIKSKDAARKAHYIEVFSTTALSAHLDLVERFYFQDLNETYLGNTRLVSGMSDLHREVEARR